MAEPKAKMTDAEAATVLAGLLDMEIFTPRETDALLIAVEKLADKAGED